VFGDPLYIDGVDWSHLGVMGVKVVAVFVFLLVATMFMVWFERKVNADMTNRIGPDVAGPWGILQTFADGIKFFFKEDNLPAKADPLVFRLAPYLSAVTAFLAFAVVPLGGDFRSSNPDPGVVTLLGHRTFLQVADPPMGILFLLAVSSVAVYGIMLAGWSSGSKYPLLGSVRASAQAISYEAALGMSVVAVVLVAGTLSTQGIVIGQSAGVRSWYVVSTGLVPFIVFLIAATAELNRPPFDLVEAEQELVGGFHTEYSSIRFALFFLAEFMNVITMSAIMVTLFFGGPAGPIFWGLGWLLPTVWFFAKVLVFLFLFVWFRATLPRLRYDQLMDLGWKVLIPISLGWLLVLSGIQLWRNDKLDVLVLVVVGLGIFAVCLTLLFAAFSAGNRAFAEDEANSHVVAGDRVSDQTRAKD